MFKTPHFSLLFWAILVFSLLAVQAQSVQGKAKDHIENFLYEMQNIIGNSPRASFSKKRDILIPNLLEDYALPSATISNLLDIEGGKLEVIPLSMFLKNAIIRFSEAIRMQFAASDIRAGSPSGDHLMATVPVVLRGRDDFSRSLSSTITWKIRVNFEKHRNRYRDPKIAGIRSGNGSRTDDRLEPRPTPTSTTHTDPYTGMEFVKVQAGTFTMGCTSEQGSDCYGREKPSHQVTLTKDYYLGKYEVTQAQWRKVMGSNPSEFKNCDNCPVENVSWNDIQEFLVEINRQTDTIPPSAAQEGTGMRYRLPTEAEWEYAARGGNKATSTKYAGSSSIGNVAWYSSNSSSKTHPVGQKAANELGLYDMSGNVREWCADWYGSYSSSSQTNPKGPSSGQRRVLRGGSWTSSVWFCRVPNRVINPPGNRGNERGFRLCLSL